MSKKRWEPEFYEVNGVRLTVTSTKDPAYELLLDGHTSTPNMSIFKDDCFICLDPEFAQMGLPLCYPCEVCKGHVSADDTVCDDCGADQQELYYTRMAAECAEKGHVIRTVPATPVWIKIDVNGRTQSEEMTEPYDVCDRCGQL